MSDRFRPDDCVASIYVTSSAESGNLLAVGCASHLGNFCFDGVLGRTVKVQYWYLPCRDF